MVRIINPSVPLVVILFSIFLVSGCSEQGGRETTAAGDRANEIIESTNTRIAEHNRLFQQARNDYAQVKQALENGDNRPQSQKQRIGDIAQTMGKARSELRQAKKSLDGVQDLGVSRPVKRYAQSLSEAMEYQISAEQQEIRFYETLQKDPALSEDRQRARELLSGAQQDYQQAQESYNQAAEIADANPNLITTAEDATTPAGGG